MSMNRIDRRFAELAVAQRKGLIPFVTAGDPSSEWMPEVMHALVESGADLIELGMPFSDPMADGPVIQQASERAIARGVDLPRVLAIVAAFRTSDLDTPVILMGYLNPIFQYGPGFFADAAVAGVDGMLLVDCPVEEADTIEPYLRAHGIKQIHLLAPTTSERRRAKIYAQAQGFVYYVSFKGITGAARLELDSAVRQIELLKSESPVPLAVGFGIRDAESARRLAEHADAVVIGSALVERLQGAQDAAHAAQLIAQFLSPIRAALQPLVQAA